MVNRFFKSPKWQNSFWKVICGIFQFYLTQTTILFANNTIHKIPSFCEFGFIWDNGQCGNMRSHTHTFPSCVRPNVKTLSKNCLFSSNLQNSPQRKKNRSNLKRQQKISDSLSSERSVWEKWIIISAKVWKKNSSVTKNVTIQTLSFADFFCVFI